MTMTTQTSGQALRTKAEHQVAVALGDRSYNVLIGHGLLANADAHLAFLPPTTRFAIVTDKNVEPHLVQPLRISLNTRLRGVVTVQPGETTKSLTGLGHVLDELLALGVERGDCVIALGGGVIGDLAGFASAVLRRGVRFVQMPTSLLALVDSSVGGKTGINSRHGKNLVGAIHQPACVLADLDALTTLSDREMRAGYAEVVKYGLLGDFAFYEWLEANHARVLARDPQALAHAVVTSVTAKARIVERDETETGDRMLLNFGHTFGHALEAWSGYSNRLLHGEAVAIGMAQAFRFAARQGLVTGQDASRVEAHLDDVGLPTRIDQIPGGKVPETDALLTLMAQDKKVTAGKLTFILVNAIGRAFVARDVAKPEIRAFLDAERAG